MALVAGALIVGAIGAVAGFILAPVLAIGVGLAVLGGALIGAGIGIRIAEAIMDDIELKDDKAIIDPLVEDADLPDDADEAAVVVAKDQSGLMNLQTKQFQLGGANTILGMKGEQRQGVGAMTSRAAARNIDVRGSPLFNVVVAKAESERQIGMAGESLEASVDIQGRTRDVAWKSFLVGEMKEMDGRAQASRDAWMGIFSDTVQIGTSLVDRFWNPSTAWSNTPATGGGPNTYRSWD
jgi:hypothetical protein